MFGIFMYLRTHSVEIMTIGAIFAMIIALVKIVHSNGKGQQKLASGQESLKKDIEKLEAGQEKLDSRLEIQSQKLKEIHDFLLSESAKRANDSTEIFKHINGVSQHFEGRIDGVSENLGGRIDSLSENLGGRIDSLSESLNGRISEEAVNTRNQISLTRDRIDDLRKDSRASFEYMQSVLGTIRQEVGQIQGHLGISPIVTTDFKNVATG